MRDEDRWQKKVKQLRATLRLRLTIAKRENTLEAWTKVAQQVQAGSSYFHAEGWPDWWSEFERADNDAIYAIRRLHSAF